MGADFTLYKSLKVSRLTSNAQFSSTGSGASASDTGGANAVAQESTREAKAKIANLAAATSETTVGEAAPWPFVATLKTANITPTSGAAVANVTDYSTVNLWVRRAAAPGTAILMASANLSNVALTQWKPQALTIVANAANYQIGQGDVITANVALTGNGTANTLACMLDWTAEDM